MYQNLSEEDKKKSQNIVVKDMEIVLKKKKTKSVDMFVNDIEIFHKIKNKS